MNRNRIAGLLTTAIISISALALVWYPREISATVHTNLILCTDTLLPSLFPFFILSSLIIKLNLLYPLELTLNKVMRTAFCLPGSCSSALILGMVGGYPTGAKVIAELYQNGLCTRDEAQRALSFCNNCGPSFLFGVVGCGVFGHLRYGVLLACIHYTAALLTGLIVNHRNTIPFNSKTTSPPKRLPFAAVFVDSVTGALRSMFDLFSFVLCFGVITKLLSISGLITKAAGIFLPFLKAKTGETFVFGLLELTHGVMNLNAESTSLQLILTAALLGWGGISVHCQVLALLQDSNLSPIPYLKGKVLHALLSVLLMWSTLHGLEMFCLTAGSILLLLSCKSMKKSSRKSTKGIV